LGGGMKPTLPRRFPVLRGPTPAANAGPSNFLVFNVAHQQANAQAEQDKGSEWTPLGWTALAALAIALTALLAARYRST
jgi:hypothetical protein